MRHLPALKGRRGKPEKPANLPAIPKLPPDQSFRHQHRGAADADPSHLRQALDRTRRRRGRDRGRLRAIERGDLGLQQCQPLRGPRETLLQFARQRRVGPGADLRPPRPRARPRQLGPPRGQPPPHLIDQPRVVLHQRRTLATDVPGGFRLGARHPHFAPHAGFPRADAHQHPHQFQGVEPIGLCPPGAPTYFNAGRIHHAILHAQPDQGPMNPEAVPPGFIAAHHLHVRAQSEAHSRFRHDPSDRAEIARGHRPDPRLHAESRCHRQLPLLQAQLERHIQRRFAYTPTLRTGRCSHHQLLSVSNTSGSLTASARSHSLFAVRSLLIFAGFASFAVDRRWSLRALRGLPLSLPLAASTAATGSFFMDVAESAGLTHRTVFGGVGRNTYILETTGTGVAFFDYDNDGVLDLFFANGTTLAPGGSDAPQSHLYHGSRNGTFTDVTAKAGVGRSGWGQGVAAADYDNDGFADLYLTFYGRNVLFHNNGNGPFTDVTDRAGVGGGGWSPSAAGAG